MTFVPDAKLRFGAQYRLWVKGISDQDGNLLPAAVTSSFTVFQPRIVGHITGVDARDVVVVDPVAVHLPAGKRLLAVAEGDGMRADFMGGINIYDVSDASTAFSTGVSPPVIASYATGGVDRALVFVPGPAVTTTGQQAATFAGPFLMSVDGPGGPDRFGVWRLLDLDHFPAITEVAVRVINQSADSWRDFNYRDPSLGPPPHFLMLIPNDLGIPEDVAAVDTQIAYIANAPNIGLQAIVVQQMDTDALAGPQVDGTLTGLYRGIAILKNKIIAVRQDGASGTLVLTDVNLSTVSGTYPLPAGTVSLAVTGLADWPTRIDGTDAQGQPTSTVELRDLAVVSCLGTGLCVVPVSGGGFEPSLLPNGAGVLRTPGRAPAGMVGDPGTQLLYVAEGTAGLTVVDLAAAGGSVDTDGDGIDDRVLGSIDLDGNRAARVARYTDVVGRQIVAVAAGMGGVYLVQVAPSAAGLTLYDTNNIEIVPDALKASDGSFVLVNDDNDDGAVDSSGAPILDLNKTGPIRGEHDLRRIDVSTPMSQGTVSISLESGGDHAALWLSPQKGDALLSLTTFDLGAGQRPPATIWVEALAPSQTDRDIVVHYQWTPPAAVVAAPVEDRAALTAVDIRFIAGQHGEQAGSSPAPSGDEKLLFPEPEAEDLERVLRGEETFDQLPNETFGRVDIVGVDPQSIVSASVHMARGTTPDAGTTVDATPPSGPTAFSMVSVGAREAVSQQDALFYDGMPLGLTPDALRQATAAQGVLPIDPANTPISERQAGATMRVRKPSGQVSEVRRDPGGESKLQVIDAREFAAEIVAYKQERLSASDLRQVYAEKIVSRDDMDGALADGTSRLILRFELPRQDQRTTLVFKVETLETAGVGSHRLEDASLPFGGLDPTGLTLRSEELPTDMIQAADGRRVFVAVYTPPTSFPWVDKPATPSSPKGAGRKLPLRFSIRESGATASLAETGETWLVRPPVVFVHGLWGDGTEKTWDPHFTKNFPAARFVRDTVDYKALNTSGFDELWRPVRTKFLERISKYRNGVSDPGKYIAATKVDAVAHSMGGIAVRWMASEDLGTGGQRFVTDRDGFLGALTTQAGVNFPRLSTYRVPSEEYRRVDNFLEGDVRSLVTIGSPFGGSPFANWLLHKGMGMDRLQYAKPLSSVLTAALSPQDAAFALTAQDLALREGEGKVGDPANTCGTAIMDLSIGSTAAVVLQAAPPGPMLVHAIATHANGFNAEQFTCSQLGLLVVNNLSTVTRYCHNFDQNTSDGIVPEDSALYGVDIVGASIIDGFDHIGQSESDDIGRRIGGQLLYDEKSPDPASKSVNSFDSGYSQEGVPFQCQ